MLISHRHNRVDDVQGKFKRAKLASTTNITKALEFIPMMCDGIAKLCDWSVASMPEKDG